MGDAKAEELTSDARRKAFKEKLVKLGYKKKTNEERLLEKMGKSSSGYDLYHKDFSSAMKHAYDHAKKKLGIEIDPDEIECFDEFHERFGKYIKAAQTRS